MREVQLGVVTDQIGVVDTDNYTKVPGLAAVDFTLVLWGNMTVSAIPVMVSELSDGEYMVWFTPDATGLWVLDASVPTYTWRRRIQYDVVSLLTNTQAQKIDAAPTLSPSAVMSGSLLDRIANRDGTKSYSASTDSLQAIRDRIG